MPTLVTMPKWGLTMEAGTVTDWLAAEGAEVTEGEPLLTVETEKAVNDVEAPAGGVLRRIVAETGSEVPVSGPVAVILAADETLTDDEVAALVASAQPAAASASGDGRRAPRQARTAARDESGRVNASPAARKLAKELGIDLATVAATGSGGRITSEDVELTAEAAAASSEVRQEHVELADGQRVFALIAGPPDATPLVFLHGLGGSQATWENVLGMVVERHRVVAIDLPGHGLSDKPAADTADYTIPGIAVSVAQVVETLRLKPAVLVGHSLGGAVAMQIALEQPNLVRGLVLVNSAGLGEEINSELLDRVEAEPSRDEARRLLELFYRERRFVLERGIDEMYRARQEPGAVEAERAVAAACFSRDGQRLELAGRLKDLSVPTLIVWGAEDRVIPLSHAIAAARAIPDGWLKIMDGIGHVPQVEDAAGLARMVVRFARSLT